MEGINEQGTVSPGEFGVGSRAPSTRQRTCLTKLQNNGLGHSAKTETRMKRQLSCSMAQVINVNDTVLIIQEFINIFLCSKATRHPVQMDAEHSSQVALSWQSNVDIDTLQRHDGPLPSAEICKQASLVAICKKVDATSTQDRALTNFFSA